MVGFRRIPCQRSLATSVDVDRITLRNSRPLFFSESGRRHDRVWVETRSRLGGGAVASGRRCGRVWVEIRPHLGQCSLTNIEFGLLGLLHQVSLGVAMLLARCGGLYRCCPGFRHRDTPFENVKSKYDFLLCLRLRMVFLSVMFSIPFSVSSGIASFIQCCCAVSYIVPIFLWPMPACQLQHRLRLQSPLQSLFR